MIRPATKPCERLVQRGPAQGGAGYALITKYAAHPAAFRASIWSEKSDLPLETRGLDADVLPLHCSRCG